MFKKLFNKTTPHKLNDLVFESNYVDEILLKKVAKLEQVIYGLMFMIISYCLKLKKINVCKLYSAHDALRAILQISQGSIAELGCVIIGADYFCLAVSFV